MNDHAQSATFPSQNTPHIPFHCTADDTKDIGPDFSICGQRRKSIHIDSPRCSGFAFTFRLTHQMHTDYILEMATMATGQPTHGKFSKHVSNKIFHFLRRAVCRRKVAHAFLVNTTATAAYKWLKCATLDAWWHTKTKRSIIKLLSLGSRHLFTVCFAFVCNFTFGGRQAAIVAAWIDFDDGISRHNRTHTRQSKFPFRQFVLSKYKFFLLQINFPPQFAHSFFAIELPGMKCKRRRNYCTQLMHGPSPSLFRAILLNLSGIQNSNETADNKLTGSSAVLTSSFPHSLTFSNAINDSFHRT